MESTALMVSQSNDLVNKLGVDELVESFFAGKSPRTIEAYRRDLRDFADFLGVENGSEAARMFIVHSLGEANYTALKYKQTLIERRLSPATINRRLASLRSLTDMARTLGMIPWNLQIKNVKSDSYRDTRGPGSGAVKQMLDLCASRQDKKGFRDAAIIRLLFDLALRRAELVSLDLKDVNLQAKRLSLMGKGKTQKTSLTLPDPTAKALKAWLEVRGDQAGPLFLSLDRARKGDGRLTAKSVYRLVRGLGEKVHVRTRPHGIRHTAITEEVKRAQANGFGLEEVMQFSRHANVSTMLIYRDHERNVQGALASLVANAV